MQVQRNAIAHKSMNNVGCIPAGVQWSGDAFAIHKVVVLPFGCILHQRSLI